MLRHRLLLGIVLTLAAALVAVAEQPAKVAFFPLKDVKPGMKGTGRTVFAGSKVEQFQVEILGVLHNVGPQQSIILARLSGGPLEKTGLLAGMSGSPVYIDGKLVGAVALSFPLSAPAAYTDPALLGPLVTAHARAVMADACPAYNAEAVEVAARRHFGVEAALNPEERRTLERLLDGLTLDLDDEPRHE